MRDGYELARRRSAGRLDVGREDVAGAESLLDRAGPMVARRCWPTPGAWRPASVSARRGALPAGASACSSPRRAGPVISLAERLLADAWVVERLEDLPRDFAGIAVTRGGRVWFAAWGEVRQLGEGGTERVLARRNERDRLIAARPSGPRRRSTARGGRAARAAAARAGARRGREAALLRDRSARATERPPRPSGAAEWLIEHRRAPPRRARWP